MTDLHPLMNDAMRHQFKGFLSFCPPGRWVFQPFHLPLLVQIEQGVHSDDAIIHTSLARDGSGPLMTSFVTTMLIEGAHGTTNEGLSVACGGLSVSYFIFRSTENLDAIQFLQLLFNFAELVHWSSNDLLLQKVALMPAPDEDWMPPQLTRA